ncbi:CPBP family intramembrane metalloprotease [Candidatus Woesearchaeota archaeon]|nr:CPBP family intramembrane metalloprotease [Candidatus Woesearchaeota archaeon]
MTPPIYISSKLAKIANDQNAVLNWESPIIDVFKEYYNQIYRVAILEEMFFRGYIQYFLFFLLVYYFRNVAKSEDKRVNKLIYQPVIFLVPIIISVLIFMLYHNFYLESSLQVSSSMYKVTLLIYLLGSIISALIINRTGNLWLAIFFHAGWNALQFISNLLLFSNYSIIINFLGSIMLSNQVPREIVDQIVLLIVSIVS